MKTFHEYEVLERLGEGDGVETHLVRHRGHLYALRLFDADSLERLERARLFRPTHPRVPDIIDFGRESDTGWLVREWIEGRSLDQIRRDVADSAPLVAALLHVIIEIAELCVFLHTRGRGGFTPVAHNDIDEHSIIVDEQAVCHLVDFDYAGPARETRSHRSIDNRRLRGYSDELPGLADVAALKRLVDALVAPLLHDSDVIPLASLRAVRMALSDKVRDAASLAGTLRRAKRHLGQSDDVVREALV